LKGREAINAEIVAWSKDFEPRAESQDVSSVQLRVAGLKDNDADRATLEKTIAAAFEGHHYAYRIEALKSGAIEARAVVAFAGTIGEGKTATRERFSVTERRVGDAETGYSERCSRPNPRPG
jgi:type IV secretion system T-DNA border endonuclease VirD2